MNVGIHALSVYVPKIYLPLTTEWADARAEVFAGGDSEKLVQKIEKGVGVIQTSIPDMHEDPATMAAMAAKKLLDDHGIDLNEVGYLGVATETGIDQSKSMASYVLGMLESYYQKEVTDIGTIEYKFACVGASYAIESATALIRSQQMKKRYAMVIATDIAKYDLKTPGEYTQGAGAVAMLISQDPQLLVFDDIPMATFSCNERDFFRPNWRQTPVVDGKYSVDVYCNAVQQAFKQFLATSSDYSDNILGEIDNLLFHLPFPKMAKYAASRLLFPFVNGEVDVSKEERKQLEKEFSTTDDFKKFFEQKISPSLELSKHVGNIYSGSLYLGLISLLEDAVKNNNDLTGKNLIMCSYGSGSSAKVFSGKFASSWKESASKLKTGEELKTRTAVSVEDYERLHEKDLYSVEIKDEILCKLREGMPLTFEEGQYLYQNLQKPSLYPRAKQKSVLAPKDEFAFEYYGAENSKEKIDTGFKYYKYV